MSQYIWISPEAGMKINELRTPCYVIDEGKLTENLLILNGVLQRTGARILLHRRHSAHFMNILLSADI